VEAARGICGTLRAAGLEAWFDQGELRGREVWDPKTRRQIRKCALFVPVISKSTQSRREAEPDRPLLAKLYDDPRHAALLKKLNLTE
jgi:hypothetical protein